MAIKKRTTTMTIGTDGATTTASKVVGLGAKYAKVLKFEFKGDDTNVETSATVLVTDGGGRIIYSDSGLDFGGDDSTVKQTEQSYSTVGLGIYPIAVEADHINRLGTSDADMGGSYIIAESPITIALSSGTDGDAFRVHTFVEV